MLSLKKNNESIITSNDTDGEVITDTVDYSIIDESLIYDYINFDIILLDESKLNIVEALLIETVPFNIKVNFDKL